MTRKLFLGMTVLALMTFPDQFIFAQEFIDSESQCNGMHCCPSGHAMVGTHVSANRFLCRRVAEVALEDEDCFVDHPTQRADMHACPEGTYMRGHHDSNNLLTCCFSRRKGFYEFSFEAVDRSTQRLGMHACPDQPRPAFMTGIHVGRNQFLCSTPPPSQPIGSIPSVALGPEGSRSWLDMRSRVLLSLWQQINRNWLSRIFNLPLDGRDLSPPSYTVLDERIVEGGVRRLKIRYSSPVDGVLAYAYLLFPPGYDATDSFPAVLFTHGHSQGEKEGSAVDWGSPLRAGALYLAQNGFIALAPDNRCFGEFDPPGCMMNHLQYAGQLTRGRYPQMYMRDNIKALSLLTSIPGVDRSQVYTAGLSLGGYLAQWIGALDQRVTGTIVGGIFVALRYLNDPGVHARCQTIPALNNHNFPSLERFHLNTEDIAALIAPRPLYIMWGRDDGFLDQGRITLARTRIIYDDLQIGDLLRSGPIIEGMPHEFDNPSAYEFLTGFPPLDLIDRGDRATQCNGMHCCPAGMAMRGFHEGRNWLLCSQIGDPATEVCSVDTGTSRQGAHACPGGMYMRGIHVSGNRLTCCYDSSRDPTLDSSSERPDTGTQSQGIHACPAPSLANPDENVFYMTGIHVGQNRFLCAPQF